MLSVMVIRLQLHPFQCFLMFNHILFFGVFANAQEATIDDLW